MSYWLWFAAVVLASIMTVVIANLDTMFALVFWGVATWILLMLRPD